MDITGIVLTIAVLLISFVAGTLLGWIKIPKKRSKLSQNQKRIGVVVVIVIAAAGFVLVDIFTPVWGGQVKFYAKWIECGRRPQQVDDGGGVAPKYVGSYKLAPVYTMWRDNHIQYFCTAKEAEVSGLSSNPDRYEYPNLTQEEYDQMIHRSEN